MPRSRTTAWPRPKSRPDRPTVDEVEAVEEELLGAVVRWVKADEGSRVGALNRLLSLVRPARPSLPIQTATRLWLPIQAATPLATAAFGAVSNDGVIELTVLAEPLLQALVVSSPTAPRA